MIGRANRFHGYGSLRYVYRQGQTVRGPLMGLRYTANPKRSSFRLAVVVSKKIDKSAVVRNRIRRRIYEAVRLQADQLQAYDLVVTVFQPLPDSLTAEQLSGQIQSLLQQSGVNGGQVPK